LIPQGEYEFRADVGWSRSPKEYYKVSFEMADFRCQNYCWSDVVNTLPEVVENGKIVNLFFVQNLQHNSFNQGIALNTVNVKAENARGLMESLWVSFFIGGMTFLVQGLVSFIHVVFEGHYNNLCRAFCANCVTADSTSNLCVIIKSATSSIIKTNLGK
jgi:hypothetical protein